MAQNLLSRLYKQDDTNETMCNLNNKLSMPIASDLSQNSDLNDGVSLDIPFDITKSIYERMNEAIMNVSSTAKEYIGFDATTNINSEIKIFATTGKRTANLDMLYNALITIPPTSIESERAFSAAGLFITKIRTSLSDKSVNVLCFLRNFFMNN